MKKRREVTTVVTADGRKRATFASLREAVATVKEEKAKTAGTSDGEFAKTPAGYNRQSNAFIANMLRHENPVVRAAGVSQSTVPSTLLRISLKTEQDPQVLRAILMNPKITVKAIVEFTKDSRCDQFDEDTELRDHLVARVSTD